MPASRPILFTHAPRPIVAALLVSAVGVITTAAAGAAPAATEVNAVVAPHGLWSQAVTPEWVTADDTVPIELGVKFSAAVDGVIDGIEFYKGPKNVGTHVGTLWDSKGNVVRKATFRNETATGWQYVKFATPLTVNAGAQFTASYHTTVGRFSLTRGYFTGRSVVGAGLVARPDAGVYRYGASGRPTATSTGSNYFVDVRFRPKPGATSAPTPTPTPTYTPTPTPSPSQTPTPPPVAKTRDKYLQPFSPQSIWNMPIGSGAVYKPLNMTPPKTAYGTDEVYLSFDPQAPFRKLIERDYWWPWSSGTSVPGKDSGVQVRVPDSWVLAPPLPQALPNRGTAALRADGKAQEFQYTVRPKVGSNISFHGILRSVLSLDGDGLTSPSNFGGHGGSGMTGIGGTIRAGELTSDEPIRHALAVTMNMAKWGTKQGGNVVNGFRWPAVAADSHYANPAQGVGYGTLGAFGGQAKDGLGMGTLLAIPAEVDLSSLQFETKQGAKLAWTHQNYGAYVVDTSGDDGNYDVHLLNVEEAALPEYPANEWNPGASTPFRRDMDKVFRLLSVVDNNSPTSIGGGGTPRQPLAAPIGN